MYETDLNLEDIFDNTEVVGEAGGGLVKVTVLVDTDCTVSSVEIDDVAYNQGKKFVEDLVCAAAKEAIHNAINYMSDKMTEQLNYASRPKNIKDLS